MPDILHVEEENDTDEVELKEAEADADKEMTEAGDFVRKELVSVGKYLCALYLSSTMQLAWPERRREERSDVTFDGVDYEEYEGALDGLRNVVPVRTKRRGATPGVGGRE